MSFRALAPAALLLAALGLAACDGKAERAETHYQRALELEAAGQPERAAIEFRNVFRLDGQHRPARLAYARLLRDQGETRKAMEHYAILVDQDRDSLEGNKELAALALAALDIPTATAAARRAFELAPEDPGARALKATVDYRAARDDDARDAAAAMAAAALAEAPDDVTASLVVIADRLRAGDARGALAAADAALAAAPAEAKPDPALHLVRLAALETLGDDDAVGAALDRMGALFPADVSVVQARVQWRLNRGDAAGAEAVLRERVAADPAAAEPGLTVARFLYETGGAAPARAELDRLAEAAGAAGRDPLPYLRARAGLDFAEGDRDGAIAAMRALLDAASGSGAPASDATRDVETELAAMLGETGDAAGRDALLASVLAADPGHVGALKLRARAAIFADRPAEAIQDMRAALKQAPRDSGIMTIMAEAHEREGSRELAGERLALAVEVSDRAPAESARYARFLMRDGRLGPAEAVTTDALRRAPEDVDLLALLGEIHAARGDWARVGQVAALLRGQGGGAAAAVAGRLETARLAAEGRTAEALAALRAEAEGDGAGLDAMARLMQASVAAGDIDGAQAFVDAVLSRDPASRPGRLMQAGLKATSGEAEAAEALYRALIAEEPAGPEAHRALAALLAGTGRTAASDAAIEAGLAATGGDRELTLMRAGRREVAGDVEGAIADYETLYARDPGDELVANNLASLLADHRADPASLERAWAVARRLRGSEMPYFQDTYGWILHRRGDSAGALRALGPAAEALPGNALVQYHAGEALLAAGSAEAARARFAAAVALAGEGGAADGTEPAEIAAARARLAEIDAARPPAPAATDG